MIKMTLDKTEILQVPKILKQFSSRKLFIAFYCMFFVSPFALIFIYELSGLFDFDFLIEKISLINWLVVLLFLICLAVFLIIKIKKIKKMVRFDASEAEFHSAYKSLYFLPVDIILISTIYTLVLPNILLFDVYSDSFYLVDFDSIIFAHILSFAFINGLVSIGLLFGLKTLWSPLSLFGLSKSQEIFDKHTRKTRIYNFLMHRNFEIIIPVLVLLFTVSFFGAKANRNSLEQHKLKLMRKAVNISSDIDGIANMIPKTQTQPIDRRNILSPELIDFINLFCDENEFDLFFVFDAGDSIILEFPMRYKFAKKIQSLYDENIGDAYFNCFLKLDKVLPSRNYSASKLKSKSGNFTFIVFRKYEKNSGYLWNAILFAVLFAFIILALHLPLNNRTVRKGFNDVLDGMKEISEGRIDLDNLEIYSPSDMGILTENFNKMLSSLGKISEILSKISQGNLTLKINTNGEIYDVIRKLIDSSRFTVTQIASSTTQLSSAVEEFASTTIEIGRATSGQAASIEELRASMGNLSSSSSGIAEYSQKVYKDSLRTTENVELVMQRLSELVQHNQRIVEFLEAVKEISDRSDLLALNASLEASKAGEAGKSFTLVATEMRRLAELVLDSVDGIKQLVLDIRASSQASVLATEEGQKLAYQMNNSSKEITKLTGMQKEGTTQVEKTLEEGANTLKETAIAIDELNNSAQDLLQLAENLKNVLMDYKL